MHLQSVAKPAYPAAPSDRAHCPAVSPTYKGTEVMVSFQTFSISVCEKRLNPSLHLGQHKICKYRQKAYFLQLLLSLKNKTRKGKRGSAGNHFFR